MVLAAEDLYRDVAGEVYAALTRLKAGDWDAKGATHAVKELRAFFQLILEERARVAKLHKQETGAGGGGGALDFEAARAEIGRRLACLRDAGGG